MISTWLISRSSEEKEIDVGAPYRPAIPFPHMQVRALGGREGGRPGERYQSAPHLHHD
jgi:hypothetical protein